MIADRHEKQGFMFAEKDVCQRGIYIPPFGEHGKHTFCGTFTTGKPDVSRVRRYGDFGKHRKLTNISRPTARMIGKGVRR